MLAAGGIGETFIFCRSAHYKMFSEYVKHPYVGQRAMRQPHSGDWSDGAGARLTRRHRRDEPGRRHFRSAMRVTVIAMDYSAADGVAASAGAVLREVYQRSLAQSDFLLVYGDVVSNMDLQPMVAQHRAARERDSECLLTLALSETRPEHRARPLQDTPGVMMALDETGRLHEYRNLRSCRANVAKSTLAAQPTVRVHFDLVECHVYVCSPALPQFFVDNFDFASVADAVNAALYDELLQHHVYTYVLHGAYAVPASSVYLYDVIRCAPWAPVCRAPVRLAKLTWASAEPCRRDVVQRWCWPLVPDRTVWSESRYRYTRGNTYIGAGVSLGQGSVLQPNTLVGHGSSIGERSTVAGSVVGQYCRIGGSRLPVVAGVHGRTRSARCSFRVTARFRRSADRCVPHGQRGGGEQCRCPGRHRVRRRTDPYRRRHGEAQHYRPQSERAGVHGPRGTHH